MITTSIASMRVPSVLVPSPTGLARIIGLLALAVALAACSTIKLGYTNLDDIAYWWMDSYLDFTDAQTTRVREDLARLHYWHRTQELPRIAAILHRMELLAPRDVSPAQACTFVAPVRERLYAIADRAEPAAVTLAMDLSAQQLAHLKRQYEKKNADYRKEWVQLTAQELRDKRMKQFVQRSELIYGKLDEPQRAMMRRLVDKSIFDPERWLAERQRRQQDALQTLHKVAGQPLSIAQAQTLMHGLIQRVRESPAPAYRAYQQALIDEACRNLSALHNSTTPAQRQTAVERLRAYQRDLRELAAPQ
jgi:hypothetical protein